MSWIIVNVDRPPRFEIRDSEWQDAPDGSGEQWQEIIAIAYDPDYASLIASAPALLAACQDVHRVLILEHGQSMAATNFPMLVAAIAAALDGQTVEKEKSDAKADV